VVSDTESVRGDLLMSEARDDTVDDEVEPQGKIFFGGIWWDSSWARNWDLYDDHDN